MKKFYSIALAAAVAFSASAIDLRQTPLPGKTFNPVPEKIERVSIERPAATKALAKAPALENILGYYTWSAYSYFDDDVVDVACQLFEEEGSLKITLDYFTFGATYDAETGALSIESFQYDEPVELTSGGIAIPVFIHAVWSTEEEDFVFSEEPLVGFYNNGTFTLGGEDDAIIVGALQENTVKGYFILKDQNLLTKYEPQIEAGWTEVGICKYQDSWAINRYSVDAADYPWYVVVASKDENPNIFRLIEPYTSPMLNPAMSGANINTESAYIEIDATDPEYVMVTPGIFGGWTYSDGMSQYPSNYEAYQFNKVKEQNPTATAADIIDFIKSNVTDMEFSTYADGIITIRNTVFGAVSKTENEPFAPFAWKSETESYMTDAIIWLDSDASALKTVTVDNTNAPVEYYNLQGIRIENPANGIFIRRQGNKATKVLMK